MPEGKTVYLTGELDHFAAARVRDVLDVVHGPAIVDLSGVRILSAAALGELARVARRVGPNRIVLRGPSRRIRSLLHLVHFEEIFMIDDENLARICAGEHPITVLVALIGAPETFLVTEQGKNPPTHICVWTCGCEGRNQHGLCLENGWTVAACKVHERASAATVPTVRHDSATAFNPRPAFAG